MEKFTLFTKFTRQQKGTALDHGSMIHLLVVTSPLRGVFQELWGLPAKLQRQRLGNYGYE